MAGEPNNGSSQEKNNNISTTTTTPIISNNNNNNIESSTINPREYYKTYDVMTGVRIAATLGSFFGLMVLLVLYKSKSKTEKALEDPNFTAAAVAEVEAEEERQIQLIALEATTYGQLNLNNPRRSSRKSLDISCGSHGRRFSRRYSSVAAYNIIEPSQLFKQSPRLPSFVDDDEDSPPDEADVGSLYEDVYYNRNLDVPRRPSNITCSSSGSSYLERRDSALTLGSSLLPATKYKFSRRKSSSSSAPVPEIYDIYYHQPVIDIKVTQPTPGGSPCGSDRALYQRAGGTTITTEQPNLKPKLAPLASISSCNSSLGTECAYDCEAAGLHYACDSLPDEDENTENGVDPFDTDSDVNSDEGACYDKRTTIVSVLSNNDDDTSPTLISNASKIIRPSMDQPSTSRGEFHRTSISSSRLFENRAIPQICLADVHRLSASSSKIDKKNACWAQETLF